MASWNKGIDFKNSSNSARIGGIGISGNDANSESIYLGFGKEPWNNTGLKIGKNSLSYKNGKVYHAGDKPTPSEIGAAAASHSHDDKYYTESEINAKLSGKADNAHAHNYITSPDSSMKIYPQVGNEINFGGTSSNNIIHFGYRAMDSKAIPAQYVFGTGNGSATVKALKFLQNGQSLALENHSHNYLPLAGGTVTGNLQVNGVIKAYKYGQSNNHASITIDKIGAGCLGIGGNGKSMEIQYGLVTSMDGAWSTSSTDFLTHYFKGEVKTSKNIALGDGKCKLNYNSADESIEFIFS